ncbi:mechanosensitive ion channel domain-containing protein [Methylotuvimicrobium sp.]|uniref:mechanosensitive ion channel domain-containing protein n=1 Tax=Methylotuvimicrobium sp. TaxID=2822413 RepID=UPI003D654482
MERPIKLGDIVDVEGVRVKITHIGGRCCQVHRFDGIDMLIPNSRLLDKSVTNRKQQADQSGVCIGRYLYIILKFVNGRL